jgi:hypothetical protein
VNTKIILCTILSILWVLGYSTYICGIVQGLCGISSDNRWILLASISYFPYGKGIGLQPTICLGILVEVQLQFPLTFCTRWRWVVNTLSRCLSPVNSPRSPLDSWLNATHNQVWTQCWKEKHICASGSQTPILLVSTSYPRYCNYSQCTDMWWLLPCVEVKELSAGLSQQPGDVVRI